MNKMKCFYHSADLDGYCSGALVKLKYPDCEMIPINYGEEWIIRLDATLDDIEDSEVVYMVDFTLQPWEEMVHFKGFMDDMDGELIWIDHHKSEVENYEGWLQTDEGRSINGIQRVDTSACALVWEFLNTEWNEKRGNYYTKQMPTFVRLLAEYDVWNHEDSRTLPFQYGVRLRDDTYPDNIDFWKELFNESFVNDIIEEGRLILKYEDSNNRKYVNACKFETELDGLKCIAVNKGLTNSKLFDSVWDEDRYDAMLTFIWRKGQWIVSLYSDKREVDVSGIAKAHGGGGHKGASGFQCSELPFELK